MKIVINEVELELNIYDSETAQKIEEGYMNIVEESKKAQDKTAKEAIEIQCNAVKNCFDVIFGQGTGQKVCGPKSDLMACLEAFETLSDAKVKQEKALSAKNKRMQKKYELSQEQLKNSKGRA